MEVLQRAINEGIQFEVNGDRLKIRSPKPPPASLIEQIKAHKQEIIEALRQQSQPDGYQGIGQTEIVDSGASREAELERRYCTGYQPPRYVHPDVCAWHIEEADPNCINCKHLSEEDREVWMDAYLNNAILRLNTFYGQGDKIDWQKLGARQQVDELEKMVTLSFLRGDLKAYIEAVDKWERCFRDMRISKGGEANG